MTRLRGDISAWTSKQSKHANVGYPLATQLICLEPDETFPHSIDQHVDALHRLLKARSHSLPWPGAMQQHEFVMGTLSLQQKLQSSWGHEARVMWIE